MKRGGVALPTTSNSNNNTKTIPFRRSFATMSSIFFLSSVCLVAIHWTGRLNIKTLLTIRTSTFSKFPFSPSASYFSSSANFTLLALERQEEEESPSPLPTLTKKSVRCILYDRPPRTGSTTVYKYLDRCLAQRGYGSSLKYFRGIPTFFLFDHFNKNPSLQKSLISRHLTTLPQRFLTKFITNCTVIFYISSARPIRERLLSKMKYETPLSNSTETVGGRLKVPLKNFQKLFDDTYMKNDSALLDAESYYENYPSSNIDINYNGTGALFPDYVIRSHMFSPDFQALLKALSCPTEFKSANVHEVDKLDDQDYKQFMANIAITFGDAKYQSLLKIAKRNSYGLQKAALF